MNATEYFSHESVSRQNNHYFVKKHDGVIEIVINDACHNPDSNCKINLNSEAVWCKVGNSRWFMAGKTIFYVIKIAVDIDSAKSFLEEATKF